MDTTRTRPPDPPASSTPTPTPGQALAPGSRRRTPARRPLRPRIMRQLELPIIRGFVRIAVRQQRLTGRYSQAVEQAIAEVLSELPMTDNHAPRHTAAVGAVEEQFHRLFYEDRETWQRTRWLGTTTWKCPLDLWIYQEILSEVRPGLIVETGTAYGGSANFLAVICDALGDGQVVSVDLDPKPGLPPHPRVTYITASSTDPVVVDRIRGMVPADKPVIVVLDSDHSEKHVLDELHAYADIVTPGSYLIVEDTNVNGHPVLQSHGPGPMEAVSRFLSERRDFVVDSSRERYHLTLNPRGYLRRRSEPEA